jgi:hypothetical protein
MGRTEPHPADHDPTCARYRRITRRVIEDFVKRPTRHGDKALLEGHTKREVEVLQLLACTPGSWSAGFDEAALVGEHDSLHSVTEAEFGE